MEHHPIAWCGGFSAPCHFPILLKCYFPAPEMEKVPKQHCLGSWSLNSGAAMQQSTLSSDSHPCPKMGLQPQDPRTAFLAVRAACRAATTTGPKQMRSAQALGAPTPGAEPHSGVHSPHPQHAQLIDTFPQCACRWPGHLNQSLADRMFPLIMGKYSMSLSSLPPAISN